jgi:hypothetical protein
MDRVLGEAALPRSTGEYTGRMEVGRGVPAEPSLSSRLCRQGALRSAPGMRPMLIHHLKWSWKAG